MSTVRTRTQDGLSVGDIATMLAVQAEALVLDLLPHGRRCGPEWRCGSLAGEPGQSLGVHLHGPKAGVWCDFASGEAGDALDLVTRVACGGDRAAGVRWARSFLGLSDAPRARVLAQQAAQRKVQNDARAQAQADGRRRAALRMWLEAEAGLIGTPVAAYLAGRGLRFAELGRVPRALRYHPALEHPHTCLHDAYGRVRYGTGTRYPAMVAAITDAAGVHVATHRTYLAARADGSVGKAALRDAKLTLGGWRGGAIRLWRGASGKPLAEAPEDDVVAIAEGIEDALTIARIQPEWRVLAAVALGNMAFLDLPAQIRNVMLVFDRDGENDQARCAREAAIVHFQRQGRAVRVVTPPEGFKDFNDWWCADGH